MKITYCYWYLDGLVIRSSQEGLSITGKIHTPHGCRVGLENRGLPFPSQRRVGGGGGGGGEKMEEQGQDNQSSEQPT